MVVIGSFDADSSIPTPLSQALCHEINIRFSFKCHEINIRFRPQCHEINQIAAGQCAPRPAAAGPWGGSVAQASWAEAVVSSNVVGYQKLDIPAGGYALLANPFVEVGTGSTTPEGYAINDMFADDTDKSTAGNSMGLGDQLQVWDPTVQGYTTYFFSARTTPAKQWAAVATPRVATEESFELGDGFWYLNRSSESYKLTVSGEVSTKEVQVTLAPSGYTLVCNPFPVDLPLNDENIDWATAGSTAGNSMGLGDQIQIWDTAVQGYTTYFFSARTTPAKQWAAVATPRVATEDAIPAGQGFWYLNRGDTAITITLKSPIAD